MKESPCARFVIGTEAGILHRLQKENPGKEFFPIGGLVCEDMKKITLEKLRDALFNMRYEVKVPDEIAKKVRSRISKKRPDQKPSLPSIDVLCGIGV